MTIRKVTESEIRAIRKMADEGPGPFGCDCESSPELCHCSTIMMICDELLEARGFLVGEVGKL